MLFENIENKEKYYHTFKIRKRQKGKYRRISAPTGELKETQQRILETQLSKYVPPSIVHGFTKDKSPLTNAIQHVGCKILITIDINNFFPSITKEMVKKGLLAHVTNDKVQAETISELITLNDKLPQGTPTSPAMSNIVMHGFDTDIERLLKKEKKKLTISTTFENLFGGSLLQDRTTDYQDQINFKQDFNITRYGDDIAISSTETNFNYRPIIKYITFLLRQNGFRLNHRKTKIRPHYTRMTVTGIVINEKPNVQREKWRNFRAKLHNIKKANMPLSLEYKQQLRGYIEWILTLNPYRGKQFLKEYEKILKIT